MADITTRNDLISALGILRRDGQFTHGDGFTIAFTGEPQTYDTLQLSDDTGVLDKPPLPVMEAALDTYLAEVAAQQQAKADAEADRDELRGQKAQNALARIDDDLAALPAATNNEVKQIIGRLLNRQRVIIRALWRELEA